MAVCYNNPEHSEKSATEIREGWLLWLNAEEGSLPREEGLSLAGCFTDRKMQSTGKASQMLGKTISASIKSQRGWREDRRGHGASLEAWVEYLQKNSTAFNEGQ